MNVTPYQAGFIMFTVVNFGEVLRRAVVSMLKVLVEADADGLEEEPDEPATKGPRT